jgi:hypothetical protein
LFFRTNGNVCGPALRIGGIQQQLESLSRIFSLAPLAGPSLREVEMRREKVVWYVRLQRFRNEEEKRRRIPSLEIQMTEIQLNFQRNAE